jgi:micrococcal nuclease
LYEYKAKVDRVIDGDTVDFIVDLGFNVNIKIRGRFSGVDTPERGHEQWAFASQECARLLEGAAMKLRGGGSNPDWLVIIKTKKTGKYGRWIVEIDGVTDILAKTWPYGGKK